MPGPVPNADQEFVDGLPRVPSTALPYPLDAVSARHQGFAGVDRLSAEIQLEFLEGYGDAPIVNKYSVNGLFLADGRFSLMMPKWVRDEAGVDRHLIEELCYDGATLASGTVGAETYQAYSSTYAGMDYARGTQAGFLFSLQLWVKDPFSILRLLNTQYVVEEISGNRVRITETYPQPHFPAWAGSTIYTIDTSQGRPLPIQIDVMSAGGALVRRREYSTYKPVEAGLWRPFEIVESKFRGGSPQPYLIVRTKVSSVGKAYGDIDEAASLLVLPEPASGWWVIHE